MPDPTWSPVDDATADLLALVAHDEMHPHPAEEWDEYVRAIRHAADERGMVDPNRLRQLVRGVVAPKRIGAFTSRAKAEGLLVDTGEWVTSTDREGRNAGRPVRVYRLGGAL